jgi:hypothetical protein
MGIVAITALMSFTLQAQVQSQAKSMWDLWWTKWHWDKFFSEYFGFSITIIPPMFHTQISVICH